MCDLKYKELFKVIKMTQESYITLDETTDFILMYRYECAYLLVKAAKEEIYLGDFYGNPTCGFISNVNNWCIVCGVTFVIWTKNEIVEIADNDLSYVFEVRQIAKNKVELLIDPWVENAAIWEFDITTKEKHKIKDFPYYKNKEYTNNVEW